MTANDVTKPAEGDEPRPAGEITWQDGNVPFSPHFGDIYFNPKDGLAETRYVFLEGNNLPTGWQDRESFVIGETGFGTGLNFWPLGNAGTLILNDPNACISFPLKNTRCRAMT